MAAASATVKRVFLELGGKSAFVLLDDGDPALAAMVCAFAATSHSGQGCAITSRLVVPRAMYDDVVDQAAAMEACVEHAVAKYGALEVVVHNAFRGGRAHRLEDLDLDLWTENSRTAAWGSYYSAQIAYPHLAAAKERGRLVLVTSPAGVEGSGGIPVYGPVKAAQRALAKSLAREWGPLGVTVNCIAPVAETPALEYAFNERPELKTRVEERTALRRIGDAERDIGGVVAFLASDAGGYITGQTVVCDGGSFMGL